MQHFFITCTRGLLLNTTEYYRCLEYVVLALISLKKTDTDTRILTHSLRKLLHNLAGFLFVWWWGFFFVVLVVVVCCFFLSGCEEVRTGNISKYIRSFKVLPNLGCSMNILRQTPPKLVASFLVLDNLLSMSPNITIKYFS